MLDYLCIMLDARLARMGARGASSVEYGLLISGIAALIAIIVYTFGGSLSNVFQATCNSIGTSANSGNC
jgi:pilus assembly protein Flp/PilA